MQTEGKTYNITDEQLNKWYSLINNGKRAQLYSDMLRHFSLPAWGIESFDSPLSETEKFKTIYAFNGVICTVENYNNVRAILRDLYLALDEGGSLLIDIPAHWEQMVNTGDKVWRIGKQCFDTQSGEFFQYSYYDEVDYLEQTCVTHFRYEVSRENNILAVRNDSVKMRWFGLHEFETMLLLAGFSSIRYQRIEDDNKNFYILFTANK